MKSKIKINEALYMQVLAKHRSFEVKNMNNLSIYDQYLSVALTISNKRKLV